jgi:hypothetical protein
MNRFYNTDLLKKEGVKMLELISDLYQDQSKLPVQPKVEPGFLRAQFSDLPPEEGE